MNRRKYKKRAYELRRSRRLYRRRIHFKKKQKIEPKKSVNDRSTVKVRSRVRKYKPIPVKAPRDLRLLHNIRECVFFFKRIRSAQDAYTLNGKKRIKINLRGVEHIDFASTMLLDAIGEELKNQGEPCFISGNIPTNRECA